MSGLVLSSAQHTHRMASGVTGGFPGDHWNEPGNENSPIGLMVPAYDPTLRTVRPDLLFESDWRALDAIGWNISFPPPAVLPEGNEQDAPPDGKPSASVTPVLEWITGARTDFSSIAVYEGPSVQTSLKVLDATNILASSYTIAPGILKAGATYTWIVTGHNANGFAPSEPWTFTTASCPADFNMDGELTVADFSAFRDAYLAGDMAADFNGDGQLTVADFSEFRDAYLAGCS